MAPEDDNAKRPDLDGLRTLSEEDLLKAGRRPGLQRLKPGETFAGRYAIEALIGEGGSGSIYRALDRHTSRPIALKLIRTDHLVTPEAHARLVREAVTTRDIRHPNVVAVYDASETDGQPYMTMEHLAGQSLRAWQRDQLRAGAECAFADAQAVILDGLEAAHAERVIHRDLKPENVFLLAPPLDGKVRLKLLDFGIAIAAGQVDPPGSGSGTAWYRAPEQITAPDSVTPSADLYSLSVMFYELLVGVLPQGSWQPPGRGRDDTPEAVDKLIEMGLSNRPRLRPQSVADYRKALLDAAAQKKKPAKPQAEKDAIKEDIDALKRVIDKKPPPQAEEKKPPKPRKPPETRAAEAKPAESKPEPKKADPPRPAPEPIAATRARAAKLYVEKSNPAAMAEARRLYQTCAETGDAEAMMHLGFMLENGLGGPKDSAAAAKWFAKGADVDHPGCLSNYGYMLADGHGVPKNPERALFFYRRAADRGDKFGMLNAGLAYSRGQGAGDGKPAPASALEMFRKLAELGDAQGQFNYGDLLLFGRHGLRKDAPAGREWLRKSAEAGYASAMLVYGLALSEGLGGKIDNEGARKWLLKSAELGEPDGMRTYAQLLEGGFGGPTDKPGARAWYQKAVDKGDLKASVKLAAMLVSGDGGPKDKPTAKAILKAAADKGHKEARDYMNSIWW